MYYPSLSLKVLTPVALLAMTACTADQLASVQKVITNVENGVQKVCADINLVAPEAALLSFVPVVGNILAFANGSCGSAEAISALVAKADANTVPWLTDLETQLKNAVAQAKKL